MFWKLPSTGKELASESVAVSGIARHPRMLSDSGQTGDRAGSAQVGKCRDRKRARTGEKPGKSVSLGGNLGPRDRRNFLHRMRMSD
jgi:hypothetical protein